MNAEHGVTRYRAIWISDIHLGTRGCQAEQLLDFLRHTESQYCIWSAILSTSGA